MKKTKKMESYIYFNHARRTAYMGIDFNRIIPVEEFSDTVAQALLATLTARYPWHTISLITATIDDIPENLDRTLKQIGSLLHFRIRLYFGNRRRKRRSLFGWTKRPIKQFAFISVGTFTEEKGFIYYFDLPIWLTFKRTSMIILS